MLFNSYAFILVFLPVTLAVFYTLNRGNRHLALGSLALASLVFYGWWSLQALALLMVLMTTNYVIVCFLLQTAASRRRLRQITATAGIVGNLIVLGYFKYANFFLENWAAISGSDFSYVAIVLPLGLSFFTFQKIALIVDAYQRKVSDLTPVGYLLFVSFFPQLIAGPIVHHRDVMPQFANPRPVCSKVIAEGIILFSIGLAKKVLLADTVAQWAAPMFDKASLGQALCFSDAWLGAMAYALQLYLDFSGYCDMAIGLALLFGIRLPLNFNSPYKAENIIEFWRRWHMTLSRFLRDYLYIPLGGNRHGHLRRYINLAITMLLGGLWHGAAWTLVVWGALHGILSVNHAWIAFRRRMQWRDLSNPLTRLAGTGITFIAVLVAWVFFRAADLSTAVSILRAMSGLAEQQAPSIIGNIGFMHIAVLLGVVWFAPNSNQIATHIYEKFLSSSLRAPVQIVGVACGLVFAICFMSLTRVTEFLYFQF
jgi:D-alanyl-lipoteichoic acid acyltransferase DltB (MBOAT superfamily)